MGDDRYVLITGSAKRIGRSLALSLAQAGYHIAIHYNRSELQAQSLVAEIEAMGRRSLMVGADLSDFKAVESIIPKIARIGTLAAVINSASIFEAKGFEETDIEVWQRHLAVNLTAPMLLAQSFGRISDKGRIINLLDWRTRRSDSAHFAYAVSKEALAALTRNLAVALAPRIQVNALALGAVLPPSDGRSADAIIEAVPDRRWAHLDEVAEAVRFLLEGPSYITGEVITIDGGRHLI